jgi:hypothetical protein
MRRREFIWGLATRRVVDCGAGAAPTALIYPLNGPVGATAANMRAPQDGRESSISST